MSVRRPSLTNKTARGLVIMANLLSDVLVSVEYREVINLTARERDAVNTAIRFIQGAQKWDMSKGPNRWNSRDRTFRPWGRLL
jgi:hypothetical protein